MKLLTQIILVCLILEVYTYKLTAQNDDTFLNLTNTWKEITSLSIGSTTSISSIRFSPDGKIASLVCEDGTVKLWDIFNKNIKTFVKADTITSISFTPDEKALAIASADRKIRLYELDSGNVFKVLSEESQVSWQHITFSYNGKFLLSLGENEKDIEIKIWDVKNGSEIKTILEKKAGSRCIILSSFTLLSNKKIISTIDICLDDICVINPHNGCEIGAKPPDEIELKWSAILHKIELRTWEILTDERVQVKTKSTEIEAREIIASEDVISFANQLLAAVDTNRRIIIWDMENGREVWKSSHTYPTLSCLSLSPDGNMLAIGYENGVIKLFGDPIRWLIEQEIKLPPEEETKEIQKLYQQLASEEPQTREKATQRLIEMGKKVVPVIKEGLNSDDIEVRVRVKHILTEIATRGE